MKILASIIVLFFVLFLVAPTIVACLEQDVDTTNICEDSNTSSSSSVEEVKNDLKFYTFNPFLDIFFFVSEKASGLIVFENLSKDDLICSSIFIPPPNKV
jgi:hypothetical protein